MVVALASSAAIGATRAYFSDTESSVGNTFSTGTLTLTTNDQKGVTKAFSLSNWKPGASWINAGGMVLKNTGTINGHAWAEITNVKNCSATLLLTDPSCVTGLATGGLGNVAIAYLHENMNPWTRYGSTTTPINTEAGVRIDLADINAGDSLPMVLEGIWPNGDPSVDNPLQGSAIVFDVVFHLDQI
jgi:predicted ribosomally synthesized peptide with SipW-like signal peptide